MGTGVIIHPRSDPQFSDNTETKKITDFAVRMDKGVVTSEYDRDYTLYRIGDSADLMFAPASKAFKGMSSFDDYYPWKGIRLCNLDMNGNVIAYYGTPEFTFEPGDGVNVMVEIPKFWYAIEYDTSAKESTDADRAMTIHISNEEKEGYFVSPRHQKWGSMTKDFDKIYVSAYCAQPGLKSVSGVQPIQGLMPWGINTYITENSIPNFYQIDLFTMFTIDLLRVVETCNMSLTYLATFNTAFNNIDHYAGATDGMPFHSGQPSPNESWRYRWIENLVDYGYNSNYGTCALAGIRTFYGTYNDNYTQYLFISKNPHGLSSINGLPNVDDPDFYAFATADYRGSNFMYNTAILNADTTLYDWHSLIPSGYSKSFGYYGFPIANIKSLLGQYCHYYVGMGSFYRPESLIYYMNSGAPGNDESYHNSQYSLNHSRFIYLPPEK